MAKAFHLMTERELLGRRVKSKHAMSNRLGGVPAGKEGTIKRKFNGLEVDFDVCECCQIKLTISRINFSSLELLPQ